MPDVRRAEWGPCRPGHAVASGLCFLAEPAAERDTAVASISSFVRQQVARAAMKLPPYLRSLLFVVAFLARFIFSEKQLVFIGSSHTFKAKLQGDMSEIILKKGWDKVAEWDSSSNVKQYYHPFENRISLNLENGTVTVSQLEKNDSDTYTLEWMDAKGTDTSITVLIVADFILVLENNCSSTDNAELRCTADSRRPVNCTCTIGGETLRSQGSEVLLPKNLPPSTVVKCFSVLSGQERSAQIILDLCLQAEGARSPDLTALYVVVPILIVIGALIFLPRRGRRPSCVKSPEEPNSDGGSIALQGKPQSTADRGVSNGDALEQNSCLLDKCGGDGGVNGDALEQNSCLLDKCGGDGGVNGGLPL